MTTNGYFRLVEEKTLKRYVNSLLKLLIMMMRGEKWKHQVASFLNDKTTETLHSVLMALCKPNETYIERGDHAIGHFLKISSVKITSRGAVFEDLEVISHHLAGFIYIIRLVCYKQMTGKSPAQKKDILRMVHTE